MTQGWFHCPYIVNNGSRKEKISSINFPEVSLYTYFFRWILPLLPRLECSESWLTATSASQIQAILLPQPPEQQGLQTHRTTPS